MKPVYVPRSAREKKMQRALIQYRNPDNYAIVKEALLAAGREDLIGYGEKCLIPPRPGHGKKTSGKEGNAERRWSGKRGTKTQTKKKKTIRHVHKKKKHG